MESSEVESVTSTVSHSPFLNLHDEFVGNCHLFYVLGAEGVMGEHSMVGMGPHVNFFFIFHGQEGKVSVSTRSCEKLHFFVGHLLQALFLAFSLSREGDRKLRVSRCICTPNSQQELLNLFLPHGALLLILPCLQRWPQDFSMQALNPWATSSVVLKWRSVTSKSCFPFPLKQHQCDLLLAETEWWWHAPHHLSFVPMASNPLFSTYV